MHLRSLCMASLFGLLVVLHTVAQAGPTVAGNTAAISTNMDTVFRQLGEKFVADGRTDGLSIVAVYEGKAHIYNFGVSSRSQKKIPTEHSVYEIGSISKSFTSLLLAHAISDGKVKIDDDIRKYLRGNYPKLEF